MYTTHAVSTASILARGSVQSARDTVVRHGRQAWISPVGDGWVLVLPDRPATIRAEVDPYDLIKLGRQLVGPDCPQALAFCVSGGLGVTQLLSRDCDSAVIGWRSDESGRPAGSLVEPDAVTFAARFGVPERAELLELLLIDHSGTPEERLAGFCLALGLPLVAIGATAERVAEEHLHLPSVERHTRRGRLERWLGDEFSTGPWIRRTWVLRLLRLLLIVTAIPVLLVGWARDGSVAQLLLAVGAAVALLGSAAEVVGEWRRTRMRRRHPLRRSMRERSRSLPG